ncbi:MAG TPA: glycosyltransferase [Blastocatellia bacterium]|nr:glycosyltransferase [Blastocatellia bacterium]
MKQARADLKQIAVRMIDLSEPIGQLDDVSNYRSARVFVMWKDHLLGRVDVPTHRQTVSAMRLRDAIVDALGPRLINAILRERYALEGESADGEAAQLPASVSVSVVVATRDRPDDLRRCLNSLVAQQSVRHIEIIVVDNNPASGLTPIVVAEFPRVMLVAEKRKGLSYARNRGIAASTGDIIIATDDDVTAPADWIEKLIAPFNDPNVAIVTGNVLPLELETRAQCLFEMYGGLGRGFERRVFSRDWFDQFRTAVATWEIGATANAAFRAAIFHHPEIGLFDESLGAGTHTGCSEDTYLFYRTLKAGFTIVYEPSAYVWHKHRREMKSLRRQLYNYSKGHVAYHLLTLLSEHDRRALVRLCLRLPQEHLRRIFTRLRGRSDYPLSLLLLEMAGNLAGPLALWRARRQVKREGPSEPYVPASERAIAVQGHCSD